MRHRLWEAYSKNNFLKTSQPKIRGVFFKAVAAKSKSIGNNPIIIFFFYKGAVVHHLSDVEEISKACYAEFQSVTQAMQQVDVENLLQFSDVEMCKKLDTFCPVLSSA